MSAPRHGLARLRRRRVPAWWSDAKLGIFIHWTIASVPAFAPVGTDFASLLKSGDPDAYSRTPYVEWYQNSLRFPDSPVADGGGQPPSARLAQPARRGRGAG